MTLTAAWVRSVGTVQELVFASDSRLRGGEAWDCCPKILTLPRSDCAIAFAGSTHRAYPLMLQMARSVSLFQGSRERRTDLLAVRAHTLRVFEQMIGMVHDLPRSVAVPDHLDVEFLFGGFSWRHQEFRIWRLHFDSNIGRYTYVPIGPWAGQAEGTEKVVAFAGDVTGEAKGRLADLLRRKGKESAGGFDMEPFEVLRDMIRTSEYPTVGGAPQVSKVYRFMQTQPFGVLWPDASGVVHVDGRPEIDYEKFDVPVIDPDRPMDFGSRSEERVRRPERRRRTFT